MKNCRFNPVRVFFFNAAVLVLAVLHWSCEKKGDAIHPSSIRLKSFSKFPEGVQGCSCYFSRTKSDFANQKYVYVDDYGDFGYISIGKGFEKLKLVSSSRPDSASAVKVFESGSLKVTVTMKQIGTVDETWQQAGKMVIEKGGAREEVDVVGECGC